MPHLKKLRFEKVKHPKVISQYGRAVALSIAAMVVVGYIAWQAWVLLGPPQIKISSPINGTTTNKPYVKLSGSTTGDTSVSVNGSTVDLNLDGSFNTDTPLKPGPNKLYIHTANRIGKTKNIVLIVYYNLT